MDKLQFVAAVPTSDDVNMGDIGGAGSNAEGDGSGLSSSIFDSLPYELATEVIGRVAASSSNDFLSVKLCCKEFEKFGEDKINFERMSLERFRVIPWHLKKHTACFLEKCKKSGNPESFFRQGVVDYFSKSEINLGLGYLKKATDLGHVEASYVLSMIYIYHGNESEKEQGKEILKKMISLKMNIEQCRKIFKSILDLIWVKTTIDDESKNEKICEKEHHQWSKNGNGWHSIYNTDEYVDESTCQACRLDIEIFIFQKMLK